MLASGESVNIWSDGLSFGKAGDVHPSVVPRATELKFAGGLEIFDENYFNKEMIN